MSAVAILPHGGYWHESAVPHLAPFRPLSGVKPTLQPAVFRARPWIQNAEKEDIGSRW